MDLLMSFGAAMALLFALLSAAVVVLLTRALLRTGKQRRPDDSLDSDHNDE